MRTLGRSDDDVAPAGRAALLGVAGDVAEAKPPAGAGAMRSEPPPRSEDATRLAAAAPGYDAAFLSFDDSTGGASSGASTAGATALGESLEAQLPLQFSPHAAHCGLEQWHIVTGTRQFRHAGAAVRDLPPREGGMKKWPPSRGITPFANGNTQ